jgi:transcriptional regulator with XRE-family HTH domain
MTSAQNRELALRELRQELGGQLAALRRQAGLTQHDLAVLAGGPRLPRSRRARTAAATSRS